jgi:hypothetical protein
MRSLIVLASGLALQLVPVGPPPTAVPLLSCRTNITGGAGIIDGTYPCISRIVWDPAKQAMLFTLTLSPPGSGSSVRITATVNATGPLIGQSSLDLEDLGTAPAAQGKLVYLRPSGSLSATMEPQQGTGANGEVTLQIDFVPQT